MSYSVPPSGMQHLPVRGSRMGVPLWVGIVVLLGAPVLAVIALAPRTVASTGKELTIEKVATGGTAAVDAHTDYFVLTTTHAQTRCTVRLPDGTVAGLTDPGPGERIVEQDGALYYLQGYVTTTSAGKARAHCARTGKELGLMPWPGRYAKVENLARWSRYGALACLVGGIAMIMLRSRRPRYA